MNVSSEVWLATRRGCIAWADDGCATVSWMDRNSTRRNVTGGPHESVERVVERARAADESRRGAA